MEVFVKMHDWITNVSGKWVRIISVLVWAIILSWVLYRGITTLDEGWIEELPKYIGLLASCLTIIQFTTKGFNYVSTRWNCKQATAFSGIFTLIFL